MKCPKYDSPIIQLKDKLLSKWKYKSTLLKLPAMGFQSVLLIRSLSNISITPFATVASAAAQCSLKGAWQICQAIYLDYFL